MNPVTRETVDDRWLTLITGPDEHGRAGTSEVYDRLTSAVAELSVRMIHGVRDGANEEDNLIALTYHVEQFVEREVKDFAMAVETKRRATSDAGRSTLAAEPMAATGNGQNRRPRAPLYQEAPRTKPPSTGG
jgi:hypothetical protein